MSFLRHARSIGPMGHVKTILRLERCGASRWSATRGAKGRGCYPAPSLIVRDEYAPAIPRRVALQQSLPPFHRMRPVCYESFRRSRDFHRTATCVLTVCVSRPYKCTFKCNCFLIKVSISTLVRILSYSLVGNTKLTRRRGALQIPIPPELQAFKELQLPLHFSERNRIVLFHFE